MARSNFTNLPPSPAGKSGWPWTTEDLGSLPERMPNGEMWPRISIVTPSYNQGRFLEETIRSVLSQGYPNLEYIVIDGGSTDESIDIIKKYENSLTYWESEKDNGQSHAINRGFSRSTGDILGWLNSDDLLQPGALACVSQQLQSPAGPAWLIGATNIIRTNGQIVDTRRITRRINYKTLLTWPDEWFPQQSTFWSRALWKIAGPLDERLHYVMDFKLWLSMFDAVEPLISENILSAYRYQEQAKCMLNPTEVPKEVKKVLRSYFLTMTKEKLRQIRVSLKEYTSRKQIGETLLSWVHESYSKGQFDEARQYLFCALSIYPALLKDTRVLSLKFKLLLGTKTLQSMRRITHADL